jgi:hypothetical protein
LTAHVAMRLQIGGDVAVKLELGGGIVNQLAELHVGQRLVRRTAMVVGQVIPKEGWNAAHV